MLWFRVLHIAFMVCWFAGLFYLPRIFVYYAASSHPDTRAQLAVMARRLYRFVTPFLVLTVVFGVALILTAPDYYLHARWLWVKLAAVTCLVIYHFQCGRYVKAIQDGRDDHGHVFYRFFNEVPVLFLFGIVWLAVFKPF